jgi:hypothetical protein
MDNWRKMAAVTKNRNFFNCPLLLYYKLKWAKILTAATWQWVDLQIFRVFLWNFSCSFWCVIKQKLITKEISIFINSSHFEWRARLSDTMLKRDHPRTIPDKFALIWFIGFFCEIFLSTDLYRLYKLDIF